MPKAARTTTSCHEYRKRHQSFDSGEFEASLYVAMPRVETLVRSLLLAVNRPIYRIPRSGSPGQYPGLGALLPELRDAGLDRSWMRFLLTFFTGPFGLNFRNETSHGFVETV